MTHRVAICACGLRDRRRARLLEPLSEASDPCLHVLTFEWLDGTGQLHSWIRILLLASFLLDLIWRAIRPLLACFDFFELSWGHERVGNEVDLWICAEKL